MNVPSNPYIAGNPVGGTKNFVGREDVLREVYQMLVSPHTNTVVLYGQRRIGKTSILHEFETRLPNDQRMYVPVYFDWQDRVILPLEDMLNDLARAIVQACTEFISDAPVLNELANVTLTFNTFENQFLAPLLDDLPPTASLVLLFDEFEALEQLQGNQASIFFPYLRHLTDLNRKKLQFVIAIGRSVHDLPAEALSVFRGAKSLRVSLLSRTDIGRLARFSEQNGSLAWHETTIKRVWSLTHGHPYLTQQLCSVIWDENYREADGTLHVLPDTVEAAIPKTLERSASGLQWIWDSLPPAERVIASAIAETGSAVISPEELDATLVRCGIQVKSRELIDAPQNLEEKGFLQSVDGGYRFQVELLRRWLVREKQLLEVKEELDRIQPEAEEHFKKGANYYREDEVEAAISQLQSALNIHPYHLRARLLLGQIRLEQGQIAEAIAELERAYEYDPVKTAPDYVKALLELAHRQSQMPNKQLETLQHILRIDLGEPEALKMQVRLATKLGDEALARNELETALHFFQQAQLEERIREVKARIRQDELEQQQGEGKELQELRQQGQQALRDGDLQLAIQIFSRILSQRPDDKQAQRYLRHVLSGPKESQRPTHSSITNSVRKWRVVLILLLVFVASIALAWFIMSGRLNADVQPETPTNIPVAAAPSESATVTTTSTAPATITSTPTLTTTPEPPPPTMSVTSTPKPPTGTPTATSPPQPTVAFATPQISPSIFFENFQQVRELQRLEGHTGRVESLAFSPDGTFLASAANDNTIRLWNMASGQVRILSEHTDQVQSVAFSPTGAFLAWGSKDGTIRLWNVENGGLVRVFEGHRGQVQSVAFRPDGTHLASGANDNTVRLWDIAANKLLQTFSNPTDWVLSVAFSPDGTQLAAGDADNTIYLWNVTNGQLLQKLTEHTDWVWNVTFSPDGERLASASADNTLGLWNLASGKRLQVFDDHRGRVNRVAFSPDGSILVSGSHDNTIRGWDLASNKLLETLETDTGAVLEVVFSPDGTLFASTGSESGTIFLWGIPSP